MAPPTVVLEMDLHCRRCAGQIRKLVRGLPGVQDAWASLETGLVVVAGPFVDAWQLRFQIQYLTRKRVDVVSDGAAEEPPPDNGQMVHLGPPQTGYGGYYGGGWVPAYHARRQYVPNEAPVCFHDDNPNGCCAMQ